MPSSPRPPMRPRPSTGPSSPASGSSRGSSSTCCEPVSLAGVSVDPPLAYVAVMALLWLRGGRGGVPAHRWRSAAFWAGLAALVLALDSPIDHEADQLLWVHM